MVSIADAIKKAQELHRSVIEGTYGGRCNIYALESITDPKTRVTRQTEIQVQEDIPCYLSYSGGGPAVKSDTVTVVSQTIKLYLSPDLIIPPGCRIEVTQQGRTESYSQSGKAEVYTSHQEVTLDLWEEYT